MEEFLKTPSLTDRETMKVGLVTFYFSLFIIQAEISGSLLWSDNLVLTNWTLFVNSQTKSVLLLLLIWGRAAESRASLKVTMPWLFPLSLPLSWQTAHRRWYGLVLYALSTCGSSLLILCSFFFCFSRFTGTVPRNRCKQGRHHINGRMAVYNFEFSLYQWPRWSAQLHIRSSSGWVMLLCEKTLLPQHRLGIIWLQQSSFCIWKTCVLTFPAFCCISTKMFWCFWEHKADFEAKKETDLCHLDESQKCSWLFFVLWLKLKYNTQA